VFSFATASRPVLGPNEPPIRWVFGALIPEMKWPVRTASHSYSCSANFKNAWRFISTYTIRLNDIMLN
jgi:hypothetical protein